MKSIRFAVLFLLVAGFSASAYGEWNSIGALKAKAAQGNQFIFSNDQTQVVVTILAPDVARVRVVWGAQIPPDHSYAVAKTDWPAVKVDVADESGARVLRTSAMQVRVQLSPFRISFLDAEGKLIAKDADSRGMSRDGDRIRCWKWAPEDEQYFGLGEKSTPLEKRGRSYVMWNRDPAGFDASTDPLYQSVPFFLALRQGRAYGMFFDNTFRSSFDMGARGSGPLFLRGRGRRNELLLLCRPHSQECGLPVYRTGGAGSAASTLGDWVHSEPLQLLSGEQGPFHRRELPPAPDSLRRHLSRHRLHERIPDLHLGQGPLFPIPSRC